MRKALLVCALFAFGSFSLLTGCSSEEPADKPKDDVEKAVDGATTKDDKK